MADSGAVPVEEASYPVSIHVQPSTEHRNRLTTAFRFFLALPHIILVGAPIASVASIGWGSDNGDWKISSGLGLVGAVAVFVAILAWFAILFTAKHPDGLWKLNAWYLRWRVKAIAYLTLLRDEYPPFGEGAYPLELELAKPPEPRDRATVLLRFFLALPHLFVLWFLGVVWSFTTALAWVIILFTGRYPDMLYGYALGVLSWTTRVEAYLLLLRDEYPPFTLRT
ncbi:MAG: DUF4389 domain-containing protein [Gemmatimonadota bacterium]|jgi:hypothetical protein